MSDVFAGALGIVLGIGNIGTQYEGTRHNVGFDALDLLAKRHSSKWSAFGNSAITSIPFSESGRLVLCKPQTFVNRSGLSVVELFEATGLSPKELLVLIDDLHLPVGAIRIRSWGSAGGHNGLKSIIAAIGEGFPRVRIGIGSPENDVAVYDFVLGRFSKEQRELVDPAIETAANAAEKFFGMNIEECMSRFNRSGAPAKQIDPAQNSAKSDVSEVITK